MTRHSKATIARVVELAKDRTRTYKEIAEQLQISSASEISRLAREHGGVHRYDSERAGTLFAIGRATKAPQSPQMTWTDIGTLKSTWTDIGLKWIDDAIATVNEVQFPEYKFAIRVMANSGAGCFLVAGYHEADTLTGKVEWQETRRWLIMPHTTKSEIVATAFKCVLTSLEHRAREWFLYRGRAIYQPHHDVDQLHAICEERQVHP